MNNWTSPCSQVIVAVMKMMKVMKNGNASIPQQMVVRNAQRFKAEAVW